MALRAYISSTIRMTIPTMTSTCERFTVELPLAVEVLDLEAQLFGLPMWASETLTTRTAA